MEPVLQGYSLIRPTESVCNDGALQTADSIDKCCCNREEEKGSDWRIMVGVGENEESLDV